MFGAKLLQQLLHKYNSEVGKRMTIIVSTKLKVVYKHFNLCSPILFTLFTFKCQ